MTIFSIINSTAVLPTQIMENATITIEDGIIIDIAENGAATERYVNAENSTCVT
jgi:cytosine/adenosine deaminase-related metal-dependent hydrolase